MNKLELLKRIHDSENPYNEIRAILKEDGYKEDLFEDELETELAMLEKDVWIKYIANDGWGHTGSGNLHPTMVFRAAHKSGQFQYVKADNLGAKTHWNGFISDFKPATQEEIEAHKAAERAKS